MVMRRAGRGWIGECDRLDSVNLCHNLFAVSLPNEPLAI